MSCEYKIYCSKCNADAKSKMSWAKYLYYMSTDSKGKGYHTIKCNLWESEPTKCPLSHDINKDRTKVIINKLETNSKNEETNIKE